MKKMSLKKNVLAIAVLLAASFGSETPVLAAYSTVSATSTAADPEELAATKRKLLEERHQKVDHEALVALTGTQNALSALQKNNTKQALLFLKDVSEKLDFLLAKYPRLNLIPAGIDAQVHDFDTDSKQVEKIIDTADDLLEEHRVQDARQILNQLVSEMRITTLSIPLGTYPSAIKEAIKLIDQGNTNEAGNVLYDAFNLLIKTTEIMPLPVLKAEALIMEASGLEQRSDISKETSKAEILLLTDAAKDKLKLAELLGYGVKGDYKPLYDAIDEIKDVIYTEKSVFTWDKVKSSLSAFKNKMIHPNS